MVIMRACRRLCVGLMVSAAMANATAGVAEGQGATRDLSGFTGSGNVFSVSLALDVPAGTNGVGVAEAPPSGWITSAISDGGSWDPFAQKVKWVLLAEPFPTSLTYDVAPPVDAFGNLCFTGEIVLDGPSLTIGGDECLAIGIPAVSGVGLAVFAAGLLLIGCVVSARRSQGSGPAIE